MFCLLERPATIPKLGGHMKEDPHLTWWRIYFECHQTIVQTFLPRISHFHQTADEITRLMLNALLLLNGGGLAAIPALRAMKPDIPDNCLVWPAAFFFFGLILAGFSGIASIWNFRSLGNSKDEEMAKLLVELRARFTGVVTAPTAEEIENARLAAEKVGRISIPLTFWLGWGAGIASFLAFAYGGATLGGVTNPICGLIEPLCITA